VQWLEDNQDPRPFLLWVHTYDPHAPYRPPKGYQDLLEPFDHSDRLDAQGLAEGNERWDRERLIRWRDRYDHEIRFLDDELARLVDAVESTSPDAVIVVVGDHGEGLGQHGHKEHGLVWPEQLAAPWVMVAPNLPATVISAPTTAADLLPTLAHAAELPGETTLLTQASGLNALGDLPPDRAILSRTSPRQLRDLKKTADIDTLSWTLTSSTWHLHHQPGEPARLYDRRTDPFARHDVATHHDALVKRWGTSIGERRARMHTKAVALNSGRTKALSAETAAELKALGYLD
jgi:arylsulfatase A-like enzyme